MIGCGITFPSHLSSTESQFKYPSSACDSNKLTVDVPLSGVEIPEESKREFEFEHFIGSAPRTIEPFRHDSDDSSLVSKDLIESREYRVRRALELEARYFWRI